MRKTRVYGWLMVVFGLGLGLAGGLRRPRSGRFCERRCPRATLRPASAIAKAADDCNICSCSSGTGPAPRRRAEDRRPAQDGEKQDGRRWLQHLLVFGRSVGCTTKACPGRARSATAEGSIATSAVARRTGSGPARTSRATARGRCVTAGPIFRVAMETRSPPATAATLQLLARRVGVHGDCLQQSRGVRGRSGQGRRRRLQHVHVLPWWLGLHRRACLRTRHANRAYNESRLQHLQLPSDGQWACTLIACADGGNSRHPNVCPPPRGRWRGCPAVVVIAKDIRAGACCPVTAQSPCRAPRDG